MIVISVKNLGKKYKDLQALNNISVEVKDNEIFGIVGPNGAGKTTFIECVLGLRTADVGEISILNMDIQKHEKELKYLIGAQLQEAMLPANMKVKEAIELQAAAFKVKVDIDVLLKNFDLESKKNVFFSKLSGGQKQRLFILLATVHNPKIVFFDELSTGLDPNARREVWKYVFNLKKQGKTIIISTHLLEEAQELCDRVLIIDKGKIIKLDTPENLINSLDYKRIVEFNTNTNFDEIKKHLGNIESLKDIRVNEFGRINILSDSIKCEEEVKNILKSKNIEYSNLSIKNVNLEDVFHRIIK